MTLTEAVNQFRPYMADDLADEVIARFPSSGLTNHKDIATWLLVELRIDRMEMETTLRKSLARLLAEVEL